MLAKSISMPAMNMSTREPELGDERDGLGVARDPEPGGSERDAGQDQDNAAAGSRTRAATIGPSTLTVTSTRRLVISDCMSDRDHERGAGDGVHHAQGDIGGGVAVASDALWRATTHRSVLVTKRASSATGFPSRRSVLTRT